MIASDEKQSFQTQNRESGSMKSICIFRGTNQSEALTLKSDIAIEIEEETR